VPALHVQPARLALAATLQHYANQHIELERRQLIEKAYLLPDIHIGYHYNMTANT
jgi:hypothetical protein